MRKTEIRVERVGEFFERGRKFAKAADQGAAIPSSKIVAFEDVDSLLHVLTAVRAMADDPQVQAECAAIAKDFATTEMGGLRND